MPNALFGDMIARSVIHSGVNSGETAKSMKMSLTNAMKLTMLGFLRLSQVSHGKAQILSDQSAKATGRVGPMLTRMLAGNIMKLSVNSAMAGNMVTGTPLIFGMGKMTAAIGGMNCGKNSMRKS